MAVFFFLTNIGLERDLPLLLLPTLLLRNLINGGGNFSGRPGLEMGFATSFIFFNLSEPNSSETPQSWVVVGFCFKASTFVRKEVKIWIGKRELYGFELLLVCFLGPFCFCAVIL